MAKHLSNRDIKAIINIIHGHNEGRLTWEVVCKASISVVGKKPTRQSLYANDLIKEAFKARKASFKYKDSSAPKPSSLTIAADRIFRLQNENEMLKKKNDALLEQFVVWQYNSYKYGVTEYQLNEDMPRIDRERTESNVS